MKPQKVFIRTSERTMFVKCRQHWWWSYKERRKPIEQWSKALVFGDMVHQALAAYYIPETRNKRKRGPHPAETFTKLYDVMDADGKAFNVRTDDEFWVSARDLGQEMMENYVTTWAEADKSIVVIEPEMPFQYDITDPLSGEYLCTYVGTTDALVYDLRTARYGLLEHKTAASISTSHLFMDEQASTYWCIVPRWLRENGIIKPDQEFDFMLYNFLRKGKSDPRPVNNLGQSLNRDGTVSKSQPPPLFHRELLYRGKAEQENTYERIIQQVKEMNLVREGKMPHYKAPSKDCSWCEWKDLCEMHETGSDWKELRKEMTKKWEPYEVHLPALEA